jgi:prepilin-type N-terminal cleavage/methylation domain-containing protein
MEKFSIETKKYALEANKAAEEGEHIEAVSQAKEKMRPGYSIVEIMLTIVIIAILIGGVYTAYQKIYLPTQADRASKKIETVIAGIERVKSRNGGVFPAYDGNIIDSSLLKNSLGGTQGTKDIQAWTYSCAAGTDTTLSLTSEPLDSAEKADLVVDNLNSEIAPWQASKDGANKITVSVDHVSCN